MTVMMACGHAANGVNAHGQSLCVICVGIDPGAETPVADPDLTGRVSRCSYCNNQRSSSLGLAFFEHRPDGDHDLHYDGCRGWG